MSIWRRLTDGVPARALGALGLLAALLVVAPFLLRFMSAGDYWLSILILVVYFSYIGQAWNIMMGFAGQLSLGHAIYLGLGGYVAAALYVNLGIGPWLGVFVAVAAAMLAGGLIGFLGFRFSLAGVYFALLTIAFAEFTRILFDHFKWVGGSGGLFLKVEADGSAFNLQGSPLLFYYVILALAAAVFVLCRWLLTSRLGYYWLAIREDPEAAQAAGINVLRTKLLAVLISAGLTAIGGVWSAFYYKSLFPESAFSMGRSIEVTLAPIIGGLGTLFGPIIGSALLVGLGDLFTSLAEWLANTWDVKTAGLKQIGYGIALLLIVMFRRDGVWPWLARRLGFDRQREDRP
ncbi:branched-chain amino acid ABC transporter permease [Reyranella sp. CPCC 100927]|uniref:branched-chain amino acid ABC transporter permease n=1 Tax=Reyranella sp. CPCC 100927 TaxID=2599616 RepID=UPI0011B70778|nr:branched-chain amino acid ABC transporter permease [Reyranella sp. CPCC 100927]TWS96300.1 branched-chain amino acid ABC transporter permease [Reyranella sp. CPCC 100927]